MDNMLLNIRWRHWHLQLERGCLPRIIRNPYHSHMNWPDGKFRIYTLFGYKNY